MAMSLAAAEPEELEEVQMSFLPVEELAKSGINATDIAKLRADGIHTIGAISQVPSKRLLAIRGFSEAKVNKIQETAAKMDSGASMFLTGLDVMRNRTAVVKVSTGAKEVDEILGGGIETQSITEFFGEFRTGKTQMMHTLCVTCQMPKASGGAEGRAVYVDTEGNFRPERVTQIAQRFGLNPDECLENVLTTRVFNHEQQMSTVKQIAGICVENGPVKVVIIDSIMALFRAEFCGRGELSERQQKIGRHLAELTQLATEFNLAVILANQCMADPGAMAMFATVKPVGGNVLAHASTWRVMLKKGRGDERIAKIFDSPSMPEAEATFRISEGGVCSTD